MTDANYPPLYPPAANEAVTLLQNLGYTYELVDGLLTWVQRQVVPAIAQPVPPADHFASVGNAIAQPGPDCWVVVENGKITGTHDEPCHWNGIDAVRYVPAIQPVQPELENIHSGEPYDNPRFEALCREHGIWGTAEAALCAVFWKLAIAQPVQPKVKS